MTGAQRLLREVTRELDDAGLRGWCLARDLRTGEEVALDADQQVPLASLVKVPLALAVLERVRRGELDGAAPLELRSAVADLPGGVGVTRFRHPARIALFLELADRELSVDDDPGDDLTVTSRGHAPTGARGGRSRSGVPPGRPRAGTRPLGRDDPGRRDVCLPAVDPAAEVVRAAPVDVSRRGGDFHKQPALTAAEWAACPCKP